MKLALALLLCSLAHAATWYVAVTGLDTNPGTQALPFATVQKGADAAASGDTVLVDDGLYRYNGTANQCCGFMVYVNKPGITFKAINSRKAVLDTQLRLYSVFYCGPQCFGLTVQGFVISNGYWSGIASNSGNGKNLLVKDNEIGPICTRVETSQTGCTGVFTDSAATGTVDGNYIHNIGRTNDAGNTFDHGVYSLGHIDITNNTCTPWNGWCVQTAGGYSGTISGNVFTGPVQFDGKPGQIMLWGNNGAVTIANNTSTGSRGTFITNAPNPGSPGWQWSSTACLVYGNQVTGATLGLPPTCTTTPPVPPSTSVTVIVNGQAAIKTTLPVNIQVQ